MGPVYWLSQRLADVPSGSSWLSAAERKREAALRVPKRRSDWRLGRWTAKRALLALATRGGVVREPSLDLRRAEVRPAPSGAPEPFWDGERAPWALSISHSWGRALVALGPVAAAVGCDVERVERRSTGFLEDSFTHAERAAIAAARAPELLATLLWSAKESALKALREGLRLPLQAFGVEVGETPEPGSWRSLRVVERSRGRSLLGYWRRDRESVLTVVASPACGPPVPLRLRTWGNL